MKKVVLAYSGGLDTSVAVAWLREQHDAEVITLTVDVGGGSMREGVAARAISAGASKAYVVDGRDRFVRQFVFPSLQANAKYQGIYPLATALARPLIAQLLVEVAERERADAVAHGCTGKGNDQVRFDVAVRALDPKLEVVAPMRVGMGLSREQEIDYAIERGIEIPITKKSPYSVDHNLWGRSIETGILEDPWQTPPADVYEWTVDPGAAPPIPTEVIIRFEGGVPVALDGEVMPPVELVERLNALGGRHGVGRIDHVEDRLVGIKSREIYEAPAALILHTAHAALEGLTLSKEQLRFNRLVSDELAQATYDGIWFSALHRDLREYVASSQRVVNGEVRLRLDHGNAVIVGRRSDDSLYDRALATYDAEDAFDHAAAVGFIRIFGLPLKTEAARHGSAWSWTQPLLPELPVTVTAAEAKVAAGWDPASVKAWGGRFSEAPDALAAEFGRSIEVDVELALDDLRGSIAHVGGLRRAGLLTSDEARSLIDGLHGLEREVEAGTIAWDPALEDVHLNLEMALAARIGPVAGKLHTGRSRNDQVATDLRLWLRRRIDDLDRALVAFEGAIVDLAERHLEVVMPGHTHVQPAQPVLFAHHLLAYVEMAERDRSRFADAARRADVSPLGSGAFAGAGYRLDREAVATELGFAGVTRNSIDAVGDRDFVVESLAAAALGMVHLSRLAEEIVWWSNPRFGFLRPSDAYSTGSSMMPNKRNPDPAELVRGRTAGVIGQLTGTLTLLKGLPASYQRDLQEDKPPLFAAFRVFQSSLRVMTGMIAGLRVDGARMTAVAADGYTTATSVADTLVELGVPFRSAHGIVGSLVAVAEASGLALDGVPDAAIRDALLAGEDPVAVALADDPRTPGRLRDAASVEGALARFDVIGGTAPGRVTAELARAKARLER